MSKKKHGHHGGSWKVAYADFVTAMMALFLCLWLTAQDQKIKEAVQRAFTHPFSSLTKESTGIIPSKDSSNGRKESGRFNSVTAVEMETMRHMSDDLAKLLKSQDDEQAGVQIDLTPDGLCVNIFDRSQKPTFQPHTDVFTEYGAWVFSTLAWEVSRYKTFRIELEGHTEVDTHTNLEPRGKWELSTDRANAARRKLVQSGVDAGQIRKVAGYADTMPMPHTPPAAEINRRVTVLFKVKDAADSPANGLPGATAQLSTPP